MTRAAAIVCVALLGCVLAAAAIANGGREPMVWHACAAALGTLVFICAGRGVFRGGAAEPRRAITTLAFLPPAYVAFQLVPLPLAVLRVLSPRRAELTDRLGDVMARPWCAPISVEPAATTAALVMVMACALCALLVRELTWTSLRRGSWVTVYPVVAIAVAEACSGLWQAFSGVEVGGTYWNRNHFAGFLEMVLPLAVAYAAHAGRVDTRGRPVTTAGGLMRSLVSGMAVPMLSVLVIFLGVVASLSKMGYMATLFGLFVMGLVLTITRLSGKARWASLLTLPVLAITAFALLGNEDVLTGIAGALDSPEGMSGEGRVPIWMDSLRVLSAYPLTGSGLGTYATAFLAYQTSGVAFHWTHAHNDYLELATNLGAIGVVIFGALLFIVVRRAVRLTAVTRQGGSDLVALGCAGAFAAIGLHSVVDFNLYSPANALLLAWITGIAAGVPPRHVGGSHTQPLKCDQDRPRDRRLVVSMMSCAVVVLAGRAMLAAYSQPGPADLTLDQRMAALRASPASPYRWVDLAEGLAPAGNVGEARTAITHALALGPRVPPVIRRSATLLDDIGDRRAAVALMVQALQQPGDDPREALDWFVERRVPHEDVLAGLAGHQPALQAYLRFLMVPGTCRQADAAWRELLTRYRPGAAVAVDYVNFVRNDCLQPAAADSAWTDYARQSSPAYRVTDWVFNGGFEQDPMAVPFDWQWNRRDPDVTTSLDSAEAGAGARSLRVRFRRTSAADYEGAWQTVLVEPGAYRFTAAVRTEGLMGAEGIRFRISGGNGSSRLDVRSDAATGSTGWRTVSADVEVPEGITQVRIQLLRAASVGPTADAVADGAAWVDAVTLSKVGSTGG